MFSGDLPNWADGVTALVAVITLAAVVLAAVQIRFVNRQMHREFEMQYLLRFWQLMDRRSAKLKSGRGPTRADKLLLGEYLTLCEDQIALRGLGRVTDHTWNYWSRDIRGMCSSAPVAEQLAREDPSHFPHLMCLLASASYDPLRKGRVRRHWSGL